MNRRSRKNGREIYPDEILMDSKNISGLDRDMLEGRLERPISKSALYSTVGIFSVVLTVFLFQAWDLEAVNGQQYRQQSNDNLLRPVPIFASRGAIFDRNGVPLAWNAPSTASAASTTAPVSIGDVPQREYATTTGLSHVIGYVQYPSKDKNGFYYRDDFLGVDGAEKYFNADLTGKNGSRLIEVDAKGNIISQSSVQPPVSGKTIDLSIDSQVQSELYKDIGQVADTHGFTGGGGVIMDVKSGEILALASYPEYSSQIMSDNTDAAAVNAELVDPRQPFLDRAVNGLYAPGSIVKPYIAMGALNEG